MIAAARAPDPAVDELLDVDREFRRAALGGESILHTQRDGRRYAAIFSQSALAYQHGRQHDWVIVDLEVPGPNLRWTIVTEWRGVMKGKRVVRGRETECFRYYEAHRPARKPRRLHLHVPVFI
jgi:hypothetical protein